MHSQIVQQLESTFEVQHSQHHNQPSRVLNPGLPGGVLVQLTEDVVHHLETILLSRLPTSPSHSQELLLSRTQP